MEKPENYPSKYQKDTLVDGGRGQPSIVETAPGKQIVNTPTVKEVKELAGYEHEPGPIPTPYELTAAKLAAVLVGSAHVVINEGEHGTQQEGKLVADLDQDVLDFLFPKDIPTSKITHDPGTTNTIITVEPGTIDTTHAYHVYLEIEGTGTHYGADFTVFAYNGSTCITTFNILPPNAEEPLVGFASFDDQGALNIDIPVVMTPKSESTLIYVKRVI